MVSSGKTEIKLFDKSKFTVVGSPTITDDGIASGFDYTSNVIFPINNQMLYNKSWEVRGICLADIAEDRAIFTFGENIEPSFGHIVYNGKTNIINFQYKTGNKESSGGISNINITLDTNPSKYVNFALSFDGIKNYTLKAKTDNSSDWQEKTNTATTTDTNLYPLSNSPNQRLAVRGWASSTSASYTLAGNVDLKSFSITVDGEEVFNGSTTIYKISEDDSSSSSLLASEFNIDKDYIKLQIPSNIRDTWVFERVADIFYAVISDDTESGKSIQQYYSDIEYYMTDFKKLSLEMKLEKLSDNGYDYLVEVFGKDEETLNNLSVFLVLIKILKGRKEGFKLILDTLDFKYDLTSWEEPNYKDEVFTAKLTITLTEEQAQLSTSLIDTLQKIAWNYLAPSVNIEYNTISNLLAEDQVFDNYFSAGYTRIKQYPTFNITRSL